MKFSLQCSLPSLLSKRSVYVSETGTSVFWAGEEDTRSESSEEGMFIDICSVGILTGGRVNLENTLAEDK